MKKYLILGVISTMLLAGCSSVGSNTIGSTTVGAGTGALLGQVVGGSTEATLIGAGLGAAAGALVGSNQDQTAAIRESNSYNNTRPYYPQPQYSQPYYSGYGN